MAHITSCEENEEGKYKLIDSNGNAVKVYTEEDEPVDFNKEINNFIKLQLPTTEERLEAVEMALLTLMG